MITFFPSTTHRGADGPWRTRSFQSNPCFTSCSYSSRKNAVGFRLSIVFTSRIQGELAAVPGAHELHRLGDVVERELVRDHGHQVDPGLEQARHPVPVLEHA